MAVLDHTEHSGRGQGLECEDSCRLIDRAQKETGPIDLPIAVSLRALIQQDPAIVLYPFQHSLLVAIQVDFGSAQGDVHRSRPLRLPESIVRSHFTGKYMETQL